MSKKKGVVSAVKKVVRTPVFRMRVEEDKTKYSRARDKRNHLKEGFIKQITLSLFDKTFFVARKLTRKCLLSPHITAA